MELKSSLKLVRQLTDFFKLKQEVIETF